MKLIEEDRKVTYGIIAGVSGMLVVWAVLHDQYVVRIAPGHFTEYHEPLWQIRNPALLAAVYAFGATIGPGLIMGILSVYLGRHGTRPKVSVSRIFTRFFAVIVATEVTSALAGFVAWRIGKPFYPADWFPDWTLPIVITQTIQITCYLGAAVYSAIYSIGLWLWRRKHQA